MAHGDTTRVEGVKIVMLKGEKGDTGYPTEEQVALALEEMGDTLINPWMDANADVSIDNWLDEHPEATTTVQDDSLTTAKYKNESVTEEKIDSEYKNILAKKSALALGANQPELKCILAELRHTETDAEENVSYYGLYRLAGADYYETYVALQGGCYNSDTGHFVLALVDSNFINGILVELDMNFDVVRRSEPLAIGHANGMAYNPNTGKIYVVTGSTGENANNVVIINSANLTIDSVKNIGYVSWHIAYDQDNDVYYIGNSSVLNKYDESFNLISSIPMNMEYDGDGFIGGNGLFVYNGQCYYMGYMRDSLDLVYTGLYINTFDESGNVQSLGRYTLLENSDEPENVCIVGDIGYIFSGQNWFRVYKLSVNPTHISEPRTEYFGRGDRIPRNTDLNDYVIQGKYHCSSSSVASTLLNVPYKASGFTLYVTSQTWLGLRQETIYSTGDKFERIYDNNTASWTNWKKIIIAGDVDNVDKTTSVPNSASTIVETISVPVDKIAYISVIAEFPSNATGRRMLSVNDKWISSANAVSGDSTRLNGSMIVDNRGGSAIKYVNIRAYQSSGSAMNVTTRTNYILI